jgi:hypothetical protein
MTSRPVVRADFQNASPDGRLRLNTTGSTADLVSLPDGPKIGLEITLVAQELSCDGVLEYSDSEDMWVARIDWNDVRDATDE